MKKRLACLLLLACFVMFLTACAPLALFFFDTLVSDHLSKKEIFSLVKKNEELLRNDVANHDFTKSAELKGIVEINVEEEIIDFDCGGSGFGSATSYYGFYYASGDDKMTAIWCGGGPLSKDGDGYSWREAEGDNSYYTEEICENFYYYESTFKNACGKRSAQLLRSTRK